MKARSRQNGLKPQDILILMKLLLLEGKNWRYEDLHMELGLSSSECHSAIYRLNLSKLIRKEGSEFKLNRSATKEFLFYGLPYVFPAKVDRISNGIPVAHSGPLLSKEFVFTPSEVYVWPDPHGPTKGESVTPLYKTVPFAAKRDKNLYEILSLIEALRVGRSREIKMARQLLEEKLAM